MKPKRYVLLQADGPATPEEWMQLAVKLEGLFGRLKAIPIDGNPRFLVVRTDNEKAHLIRECAIMTAGSRRVRSVLTSGSIGKLKTLAKGSTG